MRERIKAGKRARTRLHRWAFRELQGFILYTARAAGIEVVFVNPAYTSQTCSKCGAKGKRAQHRSVCPMCGLRAHADVNAGLNLVPGWVGLSCHLGQCKYALCWKDGR
ncbi:MAG: transposase [Deltaproteobacteria bacterium]|nr:transposase [Deltaproteobacteria bacterium]